MFGERIEESFGGRSPEWQSRLEMFKNCIGEPYSERVAWLCFRVFDEETKRLYLSRKVSLYLPVTPKLEEEKEEDI